MKKLRNGAARRALALLMALLLGASLAPTGVFADETDASAVPNGHGAYVALRADGAAVVSDDYDENAHPEPFGLCTWNTDSMKAYGWTEASGDPNKDDVLLSLTGTQRLMTLDMTVQAGAPGGAKIPEVRIPLNFDFIRSSSRDNYSRVKVTWNVSSVPERLTITENASGGYVSLKWNNDGMDNENGHWYSVSVKYEIDGWYVRSGAKSGFEYKVIDADGKWSLDAGLGKLAVHTYVELPSVLGDASSSLGIPFTNVNSTSAYADLYSSQYKTYFGLTEFEPGYTYDVMLVEMRPEGSQPYDAHVDFIPGSYPNTRQADVPVSGWDGELVGAYWFAGYLGYNSTARRCEIPVTAMKKSELVYSELPCAVSPGNQSSSLAAQTAGKTWTRYSFDLVDIDSDANVTGSLVNQTIVSDLEWKTGCSLSYPWSCFMFLVRYKSDSPSIRYAGVEGEESSKLQLWGTTWVTHEGIDSGAESSGFKSSLLYEATDDEEHYYGDIYSALYYTEHGWSPASSTDLNQLKRGVPLAFDMRAKWYCRNQCRDGVGDFPYVLESIVDTAILLDGGDDGGGGVMLGRGDYRITRYAVAIVDAPVTKSTSDPAGVWDEGSVLDGAPSGRKDVEVEVYCSKYLAGDDVPAGEQEWVLDRTLKLGDIWNTKVTGAATDNNNVKALNCTVRPENEGAVRIKIMFPDSRYYTEVDLGYTIELLPSGDTVKKVLESPLADDSVQLTQWLNYAAYSKSGYNDTADLNVERNSITGDTADKIVRPYDASYPLPGYGPNIGTGGTWTYRRHAGTMITGTDEYVLATIGQRLFRGDGELVGTTANDKTNYARKTSGAGVTAVDYTLHAVVAVPDGTRSQAKSRHEDDPDGSPYKARSQRYYLLLPEGLEWDRTYNNTGYDAVTPMEYGENRITSVSYMPDVDAISYDSGSDVKSTCTSWGSTYGLNGGASISKDLAKRCRVSISAEQIGNRQLLIIDREVTSAEYDGISSSGASCRVNRGQKFVPNGQAYWPDMYGYGFGVTVRAVPSDPDGLEVGSYEALAAHQFMTSYPAAGGAEAVSLAGYKGSNYATLSEAFKLEPDGLDDYVQMPSGGGVSLTAVSSSFVNTPGNGASYATVQVGAGEAVPGSGEYGSSVVTELGSGVYNYALTYGFVDEEGGSNNVVLWDDIEGYARGGATSEWKGTLAGIDLNGFDARVFYVPAEEDDFSIYDYTSLTESRTPGYTVLTDPGSVWREIDDPEHFDGWAGIKKIAIWFDGVEFSSSKPSATVYLNMRAPDGIDGAVSDKTVYTAYNDLLFSDHHTKTNSDATVLTNSASVQLTYEMPEPEGGYELPRTGGTGTMSFMACGAVMLAAALVAYPYGKRRRGA